MIVNNLASIVIFLITCGLSVFVFLNNRKNPTNVSFSIFSIGVSLWVFTNFLADISTSDASYSFWAKSTIIGPAILPVALLYFSRVFPEKAKIWPRWVWLVLGLPLISIWALSPTSLNIKEAKVTTTGQITEFGDLYTILFIYFVLYFGLAFFFLFRSYRNSIGLYKLQLRYLFWSLISAVFLGVLANLIFPILGVSAFVSLGPLSSLLFVSATSYAIVRHRLLDIEVIIRRSLVYSTLLASLIAVYSGLVFILNNFFLPGEAGPFLRVTDIIAIILVAFTVDPLKRVIENTTDKVFFKARYNAEETINKLSETLVSEIDLTRLVRELKKVLTESIKVSKLSIYIRSDNEFFPAAIVNDFPKNLDLAIEKKHFITKYLDDHHDILILDEIERSMKEGQKFDAHLTQAVSALGGAGVEIIVPLVVKGKLSGAMFLGEKLSQDIYSNTDVRFLEILSHQAALSLENAKLYEEQKLYSVRLTREVERATGDLRHANDKLKELDKLKDEFMSIASHELRTPMTAIKSYVWLALHGKSNEKDPKVRDYLGKVYESSERMLSMINDMLNTSRIETGRLKMEILPVSIWKVAEQVRDDLSAKAAETQVTIVIKKDTIAPLVMADKDKLMEIYTNLIGNALKFTKAGGKVTVAASKKGNMVEIGVADNGVGIAKENIDKLFKKYGKLNESYATASPSTGTGLGLYITRQYLEKMGGDIKVTSELGKGTTFTFSLPIAAGKDLQKHADEEEKTEGVILNPKLAKQFETQRKAVKTEVVRSLQK